MIKLCGLALFAFVSYIILKSSNSGASSVFAAAVILIFTGAAVSSLSPAFSSLSEKIKTAGLEKYASVLIKALGISYASEITADICRAGGADFAASGIEIAARAELAVLSIPLLSELLSLSEQFF